MIKLQNPNIPPPTMAVEIDKAIYELQLKLNTNLDWLTHDYGRAYRHSNKQEKKLYLPEVYIGGEKNAYYIVTPDNDKKGTCFFVVGKEQNKNFDFNQHNDLTYDVGIIFWVNLKKINSALLLTENFTQNLIKDVREVLTRKLAGLSFMLKIKNVETEFNEIYREFSLNEDEEYLRTPYSGFRVNCEITLSEDCGNFMFDPAKALVQNISQNEILTILLPTLDFSNETVFNSLTPQQQNDLYNMLFPT